MKQDYPMAQLCLALGVSRSGFYAWKDHRPSRRAPEDTQLGARIAVAHVRSRRTYGSPRIREDLRHDGVLMGRRRVARIMREQNLAGRSRKRRRPQTTQSEQDQPIAPNLLQGRAPARGRNEVWVTDITYVATDEGWLYVAGILDLYSRKIVGWSFGSSLGTGLCLEALAMALRDRRPPKGLIHHSDRGV